MADLNWPCIAQDADGHCIIESSATRVLDIAHLHVTERLSVDDIATRHPELSLKEIHLALAWYYENKTAFDQQIKAKLDKEALEVWGDESPGPAAQKVRVG